MAGFVLPYTDPATWQPIPVSGAAGQVHVTNPSTDAPCYINIYTQSGTFIFSGWKCHPLETIVVTFPAGATCRAASCGPMTADVTAG